MTRSVVVFPEPDGPSNVKNSPSAMSRSRLSIATTSPYVRRMPVRRTAGMPVAAPSAGLAGACVAKRLLEDRESALELLVRSRERRQQPDDVAVEAAREEDQPFLARRGRDRLRGLAVLLCELEREHRREPAHLADDRPARRDLVQAGSQQPRDLLGALAEPGRGELVEDGERCGATDGVAAEGPAEPAGV